MYRVLIIEDEPAYQRILKDSFEKELFEVIVVSDGNQAILEASKGLPDFILLDLYMKGINGNTFLSHLASIKGLNTVPIAILTAYPDGASESYSDQELYNNFVGFWVKYMLTPTQITRKVSSFLAQKTDTLLGKVVSS